MRLSVYSRALIIGLAVLTGVMPSLPALALSFEPSAEDVLVESITLNEPVPVVEESVPVESLAEEPVSVTEEVVMPTVEEGLVVEANDVTDVTEETVETVEVKAIPSTDSTSSLTTEEVVIDVFSSSSSSTVEMSTQKDVSPVVDVVEEQVLVEDEKNVLEKIVDATEAFIEETVDTIVTWFKAPSDISDPDTIADKFIVQDSFTDIAYVGDGRVAYKMYTAPRMLKEIASGYQVREAGWNFFAELDDAALTKHDAGYAYSIPLDNSEKNIAVRAGTLSYGKTTLAPKMQEFIQARKGFIDVTDIVGVYPSVDVRFEDSYDSRTKKIIIHEPLKELSFDEEVIFWEEMALPPGSVVMQSDGKTLDGEVDLKGDLFHIQTADGGLLSLTGAVIFDDSVDITEAADLSSSYKTLVSRISIDYGSGTLRYGIVVPSEYLLDAERAYPVTIDPTYYACKPGTTNVSGSGVNCSINSITNFYLRYLISRNTDNPDLYFGYYAAADGPATRHPVIKFSTAAIPNNQTIDSASFKMYYRQLGLGNFNGDIQTTAKRIHNAWDINTIEYRDIRNGLENLGSRTINTGSTGWKTWSITSAVQDWHERNEPNYGFLLEPTPAWLAGAVPNWPNRHLRFNSTRYNVTTQWPYVYIVTSAAAQPDLIVENLSVDDNTLLPGEGTTARVTTRNNGAGAAANTSQVGYYLSTNSSYSADDVYLNRDTVGALAANATENDSDPITIPANWDNYGRNYIVFRADYLNQVAESDENNNVRAVPITINEPVPQLPDLIATNGRLDTNVLVPGQQTVARITTQNIGNAAAGNSEVAYYLSANSSYEPGTDVRLSTDAVGGLAAGASENDADTITIPADWDHFGENYLIFVVDNQGFVDEPDEDNNVQRVAFTINLQNDNLEPNNSWDSATNIGAVLNYSNNTLVLTHNEQDWFRFLYNNESYYIKVRGFDMNSAGPYNLNFSIVGRTLTVETTERSGMTDTYLELYASDHATLLDQDDDGGNGVFSRLEYQLPDAGLCNGLCGGGGGGVPPPSDQLPDSDGDGDSDVEEAFKGNPYNNPLQTEPLYSPSTASYNAQSFDFVQNNYGADPVNLRTGAFEFTQRDFTLEGRGIPIDFVRVYNSKITDKDSRMGNGWNFSHNVYYYQDPATQNVQLYLGGTLTAIFTTADGGQTFTGPKGDTGTLFWDNGVMVYRTLEGVRYEFTNRLTSQMGYIDRIVDTNGNATTFTYMDRDELPLMTHITDASGRQVELRYGAEGTDNWDRITSIRESLSGQLGRVISYTYDQQGNLARVRDNRSYGGNTEYIQRDYVYIDNPLTPEEDYVLTEYTDPRGTTLFNEYDADGRVVRQREFNPRIDAAGSSRLVWEIAYAGGRAAAPGSTACTTVTTHKTPNIAVTDTQCYNDQGLKVYHEDGDGRVELWTYDAHGMPATHRDANGYTTTYTHDARRRLTQEVPPDTVWHTTYSYAYEDNLNRLVRRTERTRLANDPNAPETIREIGYVIDNQTGNITETVDALGNREFFVYDQHGNVTRFTDRNGQITTYAYDAGGNYKTQEQKSVGVIDGGNQLITKGYAYDVYGNVTQYTDPSGAVFTYAYDTQSNLRQETNPAGDRKTYTYDLENNRIQAVDERGFVTNYLYDGDIEDSLIQVERRGDQGEDPLVTVYERDYVGNVLREVNPRGNATTYSYTAAGYLETMTTPVNTVTYVHDNVGRVVSETNALGQVITHEYDARGNNIRVRQNTAAGEATTVTQYDGFNRVVGQTDPNGHTTTITYDLADRMLRETNHLGEAMTYQYDAVGNRTESTTARGNTTVFAYDGDGRIIRETNPQGKQTLYFYDTRGNVSRVVERQNPDGTEATHETNYTYDNLGRRIRETDAAGATMQYAYDEVGNTISATDQMNRTTVYEYNAWNRNIRKTDPALNVTTYVYDANGNLLETQLPDNTSIVSVYDAGDRRTSLTNGAGNTTAYDYDAVGNMLTKTDPLGRVTRFAYDNANRLVQETNPAGTITTYTYDLAGNRTESSVAGEATGFLYDAANRVTTITHPGNKTEVYTYDADGNILTMTDGEGTVTTYSYDTLGRITSKIAGGAEYTTTYTYDNWDQVTEVAERDITREYVYDAVGNRIQETHTFADAPGAPKQIARAYSAAHELSSLTDAAGRVFTYTYDNRGLLDQVTHGAVTFADYSYNSLAQPTAVAYGNGVQTTYAYDEGERITDVHVSHAGTTYVRQQYAYDESGNRTSMTETFINEDGVQEQRTVTYGYDALDQITAVNYRDRGAANNLTFSYDSRGNRTAANGPMGDSVYNYNAAGELAGVTYNGRLAVASAYDQNGSLTQERFTRQGNDVTVVNYAWDPHNRLSEIRYTDASRPVYLPDLPDNVLQFAYDSEGNRIKKQANEETTYYINTGLSVLSELDSNLAVQKTMVQGLGMVAELGADGVVQYVHTDALGSTIALTNEAGELTAEYDYDVFGALLGMKGSADTGYLFTGQEFDGESGLYYYNARYYNPHLGRFISRDTYLGEDGDSLSRNRYIYVSNNPLKFVDPTGNEKEHVLYSVANYNKGVCGVTMSCSSSSPIDAAYYFGTTSPTQFVDNRSTGEKVFNYIFGVETVYAPELGVEYPSAPETLWTPGAPLSQAGEYTDANDAAVIFTGQTLTGNDATLGDYGWAIGGAIIPVVSGSGVKNVFSKFLGKKADDVIQSLDNLPYQKSRPSYGKGQIDEVWENAKQADGNVYDPNTGELIQWDQSKSRNGQWDMGHIKGQKYADKHKQYLNGDISKQEFLDWYKDPSNYQPELPSNNRSHLYE